MYAKTLVLLIKQHGIIKMKSQLHELLIINAYERELTREEYVEALRLMNEEDGGECWHCGKPSVGGASLCSGHAFYALATRK